MAIGIIDVATAPSVPNLTRNLLNEAEVTDIREYYEIIDRRINDLECELRKLETSRNAPTSEHHGDLDQQIPDLQSEILTLKTRRNGATTTCRLPAEILSLIFLAFYSMSSKDLTQPVSERVDWLRCTFVCHRWREVALGCAELWTTPVFAEPALARTMLSRSGTSPLNIKFNGKSEAPSEVLYEALSQLDRLSYVELRGVSRGVADLQTVFSRWTNAQAPLLATLRLECPLDREDDFIELPEGFLRGGTQSLKRISLVRCKGAFTNTPIGSNIASLSITSLQAQPPTQAAFVHLLSQMPLLQQMRLTGGLPHEEVSPQNPVDLLKLEVLQLSDTLENINVFFQLVHTPCARIISLALLDYDDIEMLSSTLSKTSSSIATSSKDSPPGTQKAYQLSLTEGTTYLRLQVLSKPPASGLSTNSLSVAIALHEDEPLPSLRFIQPLDLSALVHLSLHSFSNMDRAEIRSAFGRLPNLKSITLGNATLGECLEVLKLKGFLSGAAGWGITSTRHGRYFSWLKAINFRWVDVGGQHEDKEAALNTLTETLKQRLIGPSSPGIKVTFDRCLNFHERDFEDIKRSVRGMKIRIAWNTVSP
ncbi:hypothetical protein D9611_002779 [Ephemerocybe angulata]|uniref:F-box domain-containing protein n=1 Tax=Ephemerocybe angulata TaxID=980116 RepID=A0A8H5C1F5_9AGAR|nr:hypothetical protein D9611_002779 [Tulosesus angulatus]